MRERDVKRTACVIILWQEGSGTVTYGSNNKGYFRALASEKPADTIPPEDPGA